MLEKADDLLDRQVLGLGQELPHEHDGQRAHPQVPASRTNFLLSCQIAVDYFQELAKIERLGDGLSGSAGQQPIDGLV
jgi:hypothetical protein